MKNVILTNGILIVAGALALGACGGRDRQPASPEPQYAEPYPPVNETAPQDSNATPMHDRDMAGAQDQEPAPDTMPAQPLATGPCPTDVAGTTARVEEMPEGMTIAFTTTGDVNALRVRVQRMADQHNQRHAEHMQAMMQDQAGAQQHPGAARTPKAKAGKRKADNQRQEAQTDAPATDAAGVIGMTHARVEETPDGARLMLTLIDPAAIDTMREPLRRHAEIMAGPQCDPMSDTTEVPQETTSQRWPGRPSPG